jgi:hypothetical protein
MFENRSIKRFSNMYKLIVEVGALSRTVINIYLITIKTDRLVCCYDNILS